jgi:hypothetical protein
MEPIENKRFFKDVDLNDLKETQRKITNRIQKIPDDGSEQVKTLKKELYYWTNKVLYKKAKFLFLEIEKLKLKISKAKDILGS